VSTPLTGPAPPRYRIPSLGWRITVAALRIIPLMILFIGLPAAALSFLGSHSIPLPLSILVVTVAGALITAFSTARYVAKPTRWYGPISVASSAIVIGYVLYILANSSYAFGLPNGSATLHVQYTLLIEALLVVPALALAAGVVTTIEDARAPQERLPYDFPP
jgi:hypothetical protein